MTDAGVDPPTRRARLNRVLGRLPLPSGRAFGFALALCPLALLSVPVAAAPLALLVGLALVDARAARREPALELRLTTPRRIGQGQSGDFELELYDPGQRPRPHELALEADPSLLTEAGFGLRAGRSVPRRTVQHRFGYHARLRGPRRVEAVHVRIRGPLGLAWTRERVGLDRSLLVVPGLREVLAHQSRTAVHLRRSPGRRRSRVRGEGGSFESLRDYVRGDDPRHLDWKATARRGEPMVRQYETERSQNVVLVLDCGRLMAERFDDLERLDHALAAAVVLARVAESWRDHVGVMAFADRVSRVLAPGALPSGRLIDELAEVETRAVEPDYPRAFLELSRALRRRSLIVVFTDLVDDAVSGPLARHLGLLARRHLPLLVALRNPALFAAAEAEPADRDDAYRRAAAAELLDARRRSLEGLRRRGVEVLDIDPRDSITAAVDAYLAIKLRGRL